MPHFPPQLTRKIQRVAQYNWVRMHFQSQDDQSNLFAGEPLSCIYSYKEDILDKVTNHNPSEIQKPHHFSHAFENSPRRGSFFFTPNSPKPVRFDVVAPLDSNHPLPPAHIRSAPNKATISKKINLQDDFEEVDQYESLSCPEGNKRSSPNRSSKNAKGLKNLSESVYQIVSQLSITKYKEVADRLVNEIIMDEGSNDKRKDEHNVKRRVYDALNVLIAAGLLRKEGKEVVCNDSGHRSNDLIISDPYQLREKQKLEQQLQLKMHLIAEKQQKLQRLQNKKNLIEYIINRNRSQQQPEDHLLRFPLIAVMVTQPSSQVLRGAANSLTVKMREKAKLYGDVDLLLQINKDKIEMDNLLNNICLGRKEGEFKMDEEEQE